MLLGPTNTVIGRRSMSARAMGPRLVTLSWRCLESGGAVISFLSRRDGGPAVESGAGNVPILPYPYSPSTAPTSPSVIPYNPYTSLSIVDVNGGSGVVTVHNGQGMERMVRGLYQPPSALSVSSVVNPRTRYGGEGNSPGTGTSTNIEASTGGVSGSAGRIRTCDQSVNSRPLYH